MMKVATSNRQKKYLENPSREIIEFFRKYF